MGLQTKTRSIPGPGFRGRILQDSWNPTSGWKHTTFDGDHFPSNLVGTQSTTSENHPEWRQRAKHADVDIGGEFTMQRKWADVPSGRQIASVRWLPDGPGGRIYDQIYSGQVWSTSGIGYSFPNYFQSSNSTLDAWGSKAIAECKPTNSVADASVFLAELFREGIPKMIGSTLWRDRTEATLKKGGSEYLNYEFGWKPIANDIRKFMYGVAHARTVLEQYERDAGRVVRRRFSFPPEESTSVELMGTGLRAYMNPSSQPQYADGPATGRLHRISTTSRRRWFSGAFTYYIPGGLTSNGVLDEYTSQARNVLGLKLTPELIWNLAPWSWAADWVSNLGDVISNASDWASDGLVLRYGYVMEHTIAKHTYAYSGSTGLRSDLKPVNVSLCSETKTRRKATPFGFGLTWSGLSPRQLAIAAALGITKS